MLNLIETITKRQNEFHSTCNSFLKPNKESQNSLTDTWASLQVDIGKINHQRILIQTGLEDLMEAC